MIKILTYAAALQLAALTACGPTSPSSSTREAWNPANDPLRLSGEYQRSFASLPLSGELAKKPWSDTYWPTRTAGISFRWKTPAIDQFSYTFPTQAELSAMPVAERAKLSPAEKYDAYLGRYDYPLAKYERARTNPDAAGWEGLCHGWAGASIVFDEPKSILVTNPQAIQIPFGSTDIKALLTFYQGQWSGAPTKFLGVRCNDDLGTNPNAGTSPRCRDTNAGAFHVVLTNQIGILGQSFIADVTRDYQVWNQPIHGFEARVIGEQRPSAGAAPGTVKEIVMRAVMTYSVEVSPRWETTNGTAYHADSSRDYSYRLELNDAGEIIGGEWLNAARPDFLWTQAKPAFTGYFQRLKNVYDLSLTAEAFPDPTL